MGRIASINRFSEDIRAALDERIRSCGYGQLDTHVEWLAEQGVKISRSGLGRHVQALRRADSSLGMPRARLAEVRASARSDRSGLLERLGRLKLEKSRVVARLLAMGEEDADPSSSAA